MAGLRRHPDFWLAAFILWFITLWVLSSIEGPGGMELPVVFFDKVEHFGYFFGGGGLLCAYFYRLQPENPDWKSLVPTVIVVVALIGWLDEWHQTFTPGRTGNDPLDWLADLGGAVAGAFTFRLFHRRLD